MGNYVMKFPDKYLLKPKGVFTVDSPPDIFYNMGQSRVKYKNKYSSMAYNEAVYV